MGDEEKEIRETAWSLVKMLATNESEYKRLLASTSWDEVLQETNKYKKQYKQSIVLDIMKSQEE